LCFRELTQLKAVFDTVEAFIVLMMKRVKVVYVAVMRLKRKTHGIQFGAKVANLMLRLVNPLVKTAQEFLKKFL
jgi:hypothetical protein